MTKKYKHLNNGDSLMVSDGEEFGLACCDCCLVHDVKIEIQAKKGVVILRFYRNNRKTGALRRHNNVKVIEK